MDKIQIIEKLFFYIVTFSYLLLPISLFFLGSKKKQIFPILLAAYGAFCFCFIFFYDYYSDDIPRSTKHYLRTLYTFVEYAAFAFLFWINIRNKTLKTLIAIFSVSFLVFQVVYSLTTKIQRLDSVPIGIETILILVYIFFFFFEFSKSMSSLYIYNHYCFWIAVGILIYLGGSFFFYLSINQLSKEEVITFGNFTYLAEVIKNILFALSLFMYGRQSLEKQEKKSSSVPFLDMI